MLIKVMMMPAMASPRTNLLAPSIAPKKSACCVISKRRPLGLAFVDDAGVQVGVDRHLTPAGMPFQGKTRGHFADYAWRPLVITTNWNHHDNHEDDDSDDDLVARDELAEGSHHAAGRQHALLFGVRQNQTRGRYVEHQIGRASWPTATREKC